MEKAVTSLAEYGLVGALLIIAIGAIIFLWRDNKGAITILLGLTEKVTAALNNSTSVLSGHEAALNSRAAEIGAQTNALIALQKELKEMRDDLKRIEAEVKDRGGAR